MLRYAVVVFAALAVAGGVKAGDKEPLSATEMFAEAEKAYQKGELLTAEQLYLRARESLSVADWRRSTDHLLLIYLRLGRADKVIDLGLRYDKWLRERDEEQRARELAVQLGEAYLLLGHYTSADERLTVAVKPGKTSLPPITHIHAWTLVGRVAKSRHEIERAARAWKEVATLSEAVLDKPPAEFPVDDHTRCVWMLADALHHLQQPARAHARLEALLKVLERNELPAYRDTLFRLASHHTLNAAHAKAEARLREAIAVHARVAPEDCLIQADLLQALGDTLEKQVKYTDAEKVRKEAAGNYVKVLEARGSGSAQAVLAFWRLQTLYEKGSQYRLAVQLAQAQGEVWTPQTPLHPRLVSEEGALQILLGSYKTAHDRLDKAVEQLEKQRPLDLIELPRTLNNLALVELAKNQIDQADKHGQRVVQLYEEYRLPPDGTLIECHGVLGLTAMLRGDHTVAMLHFEKGIVLSESKELLGTTKPQRCHLLLNVALLWKSQGDLGQAMIACTKAYQLYQELSCPDALGRAWFEAALASMKTTSRKYAEADAHADTVLKLCQIHKVQEGLLLVIAKHAQAIYKFANNELERAERRWVEVAALQNEEDLFYPRTLNYQGMVAESRGRLAEARKFYEQAVKLQRNNKLALPGVHFISHWRLASVLDRQNERDAGREQLVAAVNLAEKARPRVFGDPRQRADFYAQFEPAFDDLVDRCVRDGKLEEAVTYAIRARSRSLLEQLLVSGVNPRDALTDAAGKKLLAREQALQREISSIRNQAVLLSSADLQADEMEKHRNDLLKKLEKAEAAYGEVWNEMLSASPFYRTLNTDTEVAESLKTIRRLALQGTTQMVLFWVGYRRSYAFLIGAQTVEAYPLTAPGKLIKTLQEKGNVSTKDDVAVPLGRDLVQSLVELLWKNLSDPKGNATRSLTLTLSPGGDKKQIDAKQVGLTLVPKALRERIAKLNPQQLLVIPDGALHRLPLEALVAHDGDELRYLLDEFPAVTYCPSAPILARLLNTPFPDSSVASVLAVGDVAFPQRAVKGCVLEMPKGLLGPLTEPLLNSQRETAEVSRLFQPHCESLTGKNATEAQFVKAVKGKRFVHLATHGFAEERNSNLFGGLLLSPPEKITSTRDDGVLCLHEIYRLELRDCELALLSACFTNQGPQAAQEAGVTLAGGFLGAGARRVVATHWAVADSASADLVIAFFKEIHNTPRGKDGISHTEALNRARKAVRKNPKTSSPLYWAPFVLVGQPG